MPDRTCKHEHTRVIAKDSDSEYIECLDCGEILEAAELPLRERSGFDESNPGESLSDA
jgi:transcription initiation factor TFIIIB Brf1 subunit/transcription initiation factor TFIIB